MTAATPRRPAKAALTAGAFAAAIAVATPVIMAWEGDGGRVGYRDIVGVATSCYGHTGPDVVVGKRYTATECRGQLSKDVAKHAEGIRACIKVAVPVESFAAFTSFSFNVGVAGFCRSTVNRKLNAGDLAGACAGLSAWDKARVNGKLQPVRGLTRRRAAERALCEKGLRS